MPRAGKGLTDVGVRAIKRPGKYCDRDGLYLQVAASNAKSWLFRYQAKDGRRHELGLGGYPGVSLAQARGLANDCRRLLAEGRDPLSERRSRANALTFDDCAARYIEAHAPGWHSAKHAAQWASTLDTYASPVFGSLPVATIETAHILKALTPIWAEKPETASRVRQRIEAVFDWATAHRHRTGDNPARWRGHLALMLPKPARLKSVRHFAALPHADLPGFMGELAGQQGIGAKALAFTILTATRTGEAIGARWEEIDETAGVWTIPASRTKAKREHRVPLSPPALAILTELHPLAGLSGGFVFPGGKAGRPLSNAALSAVLDRMGRTDVTVHGFRSTFRDWAGECTNAPREICEQALGHALKDRVEAAYRRGDLLEKRRLLMEAWADYCLSAPTKLMGADGG